MKAMQTEDACRVAVFVILSLCVTVFLLLPVHAQQSSNSPAPSDLQSRTGRPGASASSHNLTINVVVTDKDGKPVAGLQQSDFTVLDNKRPDKIVSFQAVGDPATTDAPPLKIILLIDHVNVSVATLAFERVQLTKALQGEGSDLPYPVELNFFDDPGVISRSIPTRQGSVLVSELAKKADAFRTLNRSGQFAGEQLMQMSLDALKQLINNEGTAAGRKLVIWVSPGWPFPLGITFLDNKEQQGLFHTIVEYTTELQHANITLYAVDPLGTANPVSETTAYEEFLSPPRKAGQSQPGNLALQVFAQHSGGLVLHSNNNIAAELNSCIADSSAYYIVTFEAPAADGPDDYHSLQVKVNKPKLNARTAAGYYDQP